MTITGQDWYSSWFDTPYYHILYQDRGYEEAAAFMRKLLWLLDLQKGASILDLACGRGRHSVFLNRSGYRVTGVDLSPASIGFAKQFETQGLEFRVHDMTVPVPEEFDAVFNLFTSFGYFDNDADNFNTIRAIGKELKPQGYGVIDFMNARKVIANLVPSEIKTVASIDFHITRFYHEGYILKNIRFEDQGKSYNYTEKVKALGLSDFQAYFDRAGLRLSNSFGNYQLQEFEEDSSDRLILVFHK